MELLQGQPLSEYVLEKGAPSTDVGREIIRQLGHGLAAAHRAGVVHRDM